MFKQIFNIKYLMHNLNSILNCVPVENECLITFWLLIET